MTRRALKKLLGKVSRLAGLTGSGPTLLETHLPRVPALSRRERAYLRRTRLLDEVKAFRRDCFRQACIEVTGEDPDDWGLTLEELEEKYGR